MSCVSILLHADYVSIQTEIKIGIEVDMKWKYFLIVMMSILLNITGISGASAALNMQEDGIKSTKTADSGIIVFIGASYAQHWHPEKLAGMPVVNKGMEGEQTFEMLARFDKDVIKLSPRAVVIWGFINDIFRAKDRSSVNGKLVVARENIKIMISMAKEKNITPVVVTEATIIPPDKLTEHITGFIGGLLGKESYQQYVNKLVMEMNAWIKEYAAKEDIVVLDFQQVLVDSNGRRKREYAKNDGSHLNDKAYQALNRYVEMVDLRM